jgi:hypothetical protein
MCLTAKALYIHCFAYGTRRVTRKFLLNARHFLRYSVKNDERSLIFSGSTPFAIGKTVSVKCFWRLCPPLNLRTNQFIVSYLGIVKKKVVPFPNFDSIQILPTNCETILWQMDKPMPVPSYLSRLWRR